MLIANCRVLLWRHMKKSSVIIVLIVALSVARAQTTPPPSMAGLPAPAQQAMHSIDAEKIRAAVKTLADDSFEGRGTGQKGGDKAADWIAAQFKSYGLLPAGDHGSYFQAVNFYGVTTDGKQTHFAFVPKSGQEIALKFADDYVATDMTHAEKSELDVPIVWVGYGISAPEY